MNSKPATAALLAGFVLGGLVFSRDPEVVTETVTERVEVPGEEVVRYERVPLPLSCFRLMEEIVAADEAVAGYSAVFTGQDDVFGTAQQALITGDVNQLTAARQLSIDLDNQATPFLVVLSEYRQDNPRLQQQCRDDMEESR